MIEVINRENVIEIENPAEEKKNEFVQKFDEKMKEIESELYKKEEEFKLAVTKFFKHKDYFASARVNKHKFEDAEKIVHISLFMHVNPIAFRIKYKFNPENGDMFLDSISKFN